MPKSNKAKTRSEMEDTTMTCSICNTSFNSEQELRDHQQTVHAAAVRNLRPNESEPEADEQETAA